MLRRRKSGAVFSFCWALGLVALAGEAEAQTRVEGVAARVGAIDGRGEAEVLLLSDVELRARIRLTGERGAPFVDIQVPPGLLRATLDEMVGEILLAREAERVNLADPTEQVLERERERLAALAGGRARLLVLLRRMSASEAELEASVLRRARASLFLESHLQGEAAVDDVEIERIFQTGQHPFLGQELENVREAMGVWLTRQRLAAAVRRWVESLTSRTPIDYFAAYARAEPEQVE